MREHGPGARFWRRTPGVRLPGRVGSRRPAATSIRMTEGACRHAVAQTQRKGRRAPYARRRAPRELDYEVRARLLVAAAFCALLNIPDPCGGWPLMFENGSRPPNISLKIRSASSCDMLPPGNPPKPPPPLPPSTSIRTRSSNPPRPLVQDANTAGRIPTNASAHPRPLGQSIRILLTASCTASTSTLFFILLLLPQRLPPPL